MNSRMGALQFYGVFLTVFLWRKMGTFDNHFSTVGRDIGFLLSLLPTFLNHGR